MNQVAEKLNWAKMAGLVPAIIQDSETHQVLMLGYMNKEALAQTIATGRVTFFSRSKGRLWTKGENSGNFLSLVKISADCDGDAILVFAKPNGPTCHSGATSCFCGSEADNLFFLKKLSSIICQRRQEKPGKSYTVKLFNDGLKRIAQKVGEEGIETAIAALADTKEQLLNECADLIYHLLVLLEAKNIKINEVMDVLIERNTT